MNIILKLAAIFVMMVSCAMFLRFLSELIRTGVISNSAGEVAGRGITLFIGAWFALTLLVALEVIRR